MQYTRRTSMGPETTKNDFGSTFILFHEDYRSSNDAIDQDRFYAFLLLFVVCLREIIATLDPVSTNTLVL